MIQDLLFRSERKGLKKMALLVTIPCAILPVMVAAAILMSIPFTPLFFKYDYILAGVIYGFYSLGLFISWQSHKRFFPILFFMAHIVFVIAFVFASQAGWLAYLSIVSIMGTSVSNQYFRVGYVGCKDDCCL